MVGSVPAGLQTLQGQVKIIQWEELLNSGSKEVELPPIRKSFDFAQLASSSRNYICPGPEDIFSISFYKSPEGGINATQLTHEVFTSTILIY